MRLQITRKHAGFTNTRLDYVCDAAEITGLDSKGELQGLDEESSPTGHVLHMRIQRLHVSI
ncbi:hypothetical protein EOD39_3363 [Acipenser ruthenus]|uniref:Uncharacterized protein n=1 Tax=Acipenser ruthenus TaxID=7906 RepID=A0A444UNP7_ACIRT|nr:hypothetical protein EOD39_3363 [Acipenser ruthenus]